MLQLTPYPRASGFIRSPDDVAIYYERYGQGRPILLCYGLTCRIAHWRHQIAEFSKRYEVICFDYRGHHRSQAPLNPRNLTVENCIQDARAVISQLGLSDISVFGHSLGVPIAAQLAAREKERVRDLVLICGSLEPPLEHLLYNSTSAKLFEIYSVAYQLAPETVDRAWKYFTSPNRLSRLLMKKFGFNAIKSATQDIESYLDGVHQCPVETFHALLKDYQRLESSEWVGGIRCPSLIVAGINDWVTPIYLQEEMAQRIPHSKFVKIQDGSHNTHVDFAPEVNALIEEFLAATLTAAESSKTPRL